jgi:hypothetical protein
MAILKGLAAAALLGLSMSAATACDDYEDQMALAAAMDAAKLARSATPQPAEAGVQVAASPAGSSAATAPAATEPAAAPMQTTENSPGTRRQ